MIYMKKIIKLSLVLVMLDQLLKIVIVNTLKIGQSIKIISNFFNITRVSNYGAAWNILSGKGIIFIILAFVALFMIYYYLIKNSELKKFQIIYYSLIIGGIIGNLIDRIFRGYVVDFLDFNIFGYDYPVFNFADIFIVIGTIILVIQILKGRELK